MVGDGSSAGEGWQTRLAGQLEQGASKGDKAYLLPLGAHYGPVGEDVGFRALGGALYFTAFRLYIRKGADLLADCAVPARDLPNMLGLLPEPLKGQISKQLRHLAAPRAPLVLASGQSLAFSRTRILGVLNVTPDSFSDGGDFMDAAAATARARQMMAEGADILDIGAESTRPGADPVWEDEEAERLAPVLAGLAADALPISVDTRRANVMRIVLASGAGMINDVSALTYDPDSLKVVAESNAPVVLMHAQGDPQTMQDDPKYDHVLLDVYDALAARLEAVLAAGIERTRIVLDPGLGFGKRVLSDNMALMNGLALFHTLGCPIMLGASRKRFIGAVTGVEEASERQIGSVAAALFAARNGVQMVRVHDVAETVQALKFHQSTADRAMMDVGAVAG